jgi:hypothetical protein
LNPQSHPGTTEASRSTKMRQLQQRIGDDSHGPITPCGRLRDTTSIQDVVPAVNTQKDPVGIVPNLQLSGSF